MLDPRCGGLDLHNKTGVAWVRLTDADGTVRRLIRTSGTMPADLVALGDWLQVQAVTQVAMESTGVRWRAVASGLRSSLGWRRGARSFGLLPSTSKRCRGAKLPARRASG